MSKISVVVPCFNEEEALPVYYREMCRVMKEMPDTEFELLFVDDGSTDKTGTICDDYGAKDSRVKVFHVKHGGVSYARNIALDNMHGEYVAFVDGDDYLNKLYIEVLYGDLVRMKADISTCCYTEIPLDGMGICRTITPCDMLSKKALWRYRRFIQII